MSDTDGFAADLAALASSTHRMLATLDGLTDADARSPSRLPEWTRGHVITHLARNADAIGNLVRWAVTAVEHPMYASRDARNTDIAAGASRPAVDLLADVRTSAERLERALAAMNGEALTRRITLRGGVVSAGADLPSRRLREVEIHHVDLGLGYTPAHWTPAFAARSLDDIAPSLRGKPSPVAMLRDPSAGLSWRIGDDGPELSGQDSALLAWLIGRSDGDGLVLEDAPAGAVIPAPPEWS